ncbi:MAG: hypothetical protein EA426_09595 [Spirochaetaceae bacterium]|nr:MAG: hypothetical protein EA426_09595 [Spirochaetaceae bacterium]
MNRKEPIDSGLVEYDPRRRQPDPVDHSADAVAAETDPMVRPWVIRVRFVPDEIARSDQEGAGSAYRLLTAACGENTTPGFDYVQQIMITDPTPRVSGRAALASRVVDRYIGVFAAI